MIPPREGNSKGQLSRDNFLLAKKSYCSLPPAVRRRLVAQRRESQYTRNTLAIKMDEQVPTRIPTSRAKEKSWIISPPPDNASYFYGVGYGETQRDAKSDALATISAKISVEVASKFSSSLTAIVHDGDEEILNETKNYHIIIIFQCYWMICK